MTTSIRWLEKAKQENKPVLLTEIDEGLEPKAKTYIYNRTRLMNSRKPKYSIQVLQCLWLNDHVLFRVLLFVLAVCKQFKRINKNK